jgi:hypothetical protein
MFISIDVKMEVGEFAVGYTLPYIYPLDNKPIKDAVVGVIEKVKYDEELVLLNVNKRWIPFHRIKWFTFGGIELENTLYDEEKMVKEDEKIVKFLLKNKK